MANPRVFFDITANGNLLGRVVMEVRNIDIYFFFFFIAIISCYEVDFRWEKVAVIFYCACVY